MNYAFLLLLMTSAAAPPSCVVSVEDAISMSFERFDQDITSGWRSLQAKGCAVEAAALLRRYRTMHTPLSEGQRRLLLWHEGQVWAMSGVYKRAIPLLLAGVPEDDNSGFLDYALGTVAFLRRDKIELRRARDRLARLAKPASWSESFVVDEGGRSVSISTPWPPNLNVLNGLIKCFNLPYAKAYFCEPLKTNRHLSSMIKYKFTIEGDQFDIDIQNITRRLISPALSFIV